MKKFYSLFLLVVLGSAMSYAQNVAILASPIVADPIEFDANVLKIQDWVESSWTGITSEVLDVAGIGDWDEATWAQYDAVVMTESGGSSSHGKISPIGVKTCPIVSLKAYAIKRTWPQWNLIVQSAGTWFQMPKTEDTLGTAYQDVYQGIVAVDHPIFGDYWEVGEEFNWTTGYNLNQGNEAHIQCFDLDSSSAPVAAAANMIAQNKWAVNEAVVAVDGWLWTMDAVPDSGYKKTVIWGIHHMFMDAATDTFRIILQNSLAWVLDHEIPNVAPPPISLNDYTESDLGLCVFPNPVTSTATIRFDLPQSMALSMIVRDAIGRVVYSKDATYLAGEHQISLDAASMASGVYFCQLVGEGSTQSGMFVVE
jgi:hypothetical protein